MTNADLFFNLVAIWVGLFSSMFYYDYTNEHPEHRKFYKSYIWGYGLIGVCFLVIYAFIGFCFIAFALGIWIIELERSTKRW